MPDLADYRLLVDAALAYEGRGHVFADVESSVRTGEAQAWYGPHSIIVTQIDEQPRKRILHFFLAAGQMDELEAMTPLVLEWGASQGCTTARLVGRRGWTRSFLARTGWHDTQLVLMERSINVNREVQEQDHQ